MDGSKTGQWSGRGVSVAHPEPGLYALRPFPSRWTEIALVLHSLYGKKAPLPGHTAQAVDAAILETKPGPRH
jgi:hypothetical protein